MPFPFPVSHSQITTYQQCPLKYHYQYRTTPKLEGKKREGDAAALQNGIKVHKAVECFLKGLPLPNLTKDQKALLAKWTEVCYPSIQEKEIVSEGNLKGAFNGIPLNGYLDIMYFEDRTAYIVDVKTGNSLFFLAKKMFFSLQPDVYAILVRENFDVDDVIWVQHNVSLDTNLPAKDRRAEAGTSSRPVLLTEDRCKVLAYWLNKIDEDCAIPHESWECARCPYEDICEGRLVTGQTEKFTYTAVEGDDDTLPVVLDGVD